MIALANIREKAVKYAAKGFYSVVIVVCVLAVAGCKPEVGSEKWCKQMKDKSTADWTAREAKDYAKHCVFD